MAEDHEKDAQFWGYLFTPDKRPTEKFDRLLKGIATCISRQIEPTDCNDIRPSQLAAFYRAVGGDYDPLFLEMPHQSIAFIYKSLGCFHSLQPGPDAFVAPDIPALKPQGFVRWQTVQILLGPREHVPFIQNALQAFEVRDPVDGKLYPTTLPDECFPSKPDVGMVEWHETVSGRLKQDAEQTYPAPVVSGSAGDNRPIRPTSSDNHALTAISDERDERANAAQYFSNPFNRNREGKPTIVKTFERAPGRLKEGGRAFTSTIKHVVSPNLFGNPTLLGGSDNRNSQHGGRSSSSQRRKSFHEREHGPGYDFHYDRPLKGSRHHGPGRRRSHSLTSSSSEDSLHHSSPRRQPRRHRSFDPHTSSPRSGKSIHSDTRRTPSHLRDGFAGHDRPHRHRRSQESYFPPQPGPDSPPPSASGRPPPSHGRVPYRQSAPHGHGQVPSQQGHRFPSNPTLRGQNTDPGGPSQDQLWRSSARGPMVTPPAPAPYPSESSSSPLWEPPTDSGQRPQSQRFVTPTNGVGGRRYPKVQQ
ncbi:MAG: hypothetical protein M1831_006535 [Alyxoria varia]|nr:MAG: hypothetical protein M1831_006535 [Alyxoria varia]